MFLTAVGFGMQRFETCLWFLSILGVQVLWHQEWLIIYRHHTSGKFCVKLLVGGTLLSDLVFRLPIAWLFSPQKLRWILTRTPHKVLPGQALK
jgi:hypothetical protein